MKKLASFVLTAMFMLCAFFGTSACGGHNDDNNNNNGYGYWWGWDNPNNVF